MLAIFRAKLPERTIRRSAPQNRPETDRVRLGGIVVGPVIAGEFAILGQTGQTMATTRASRPKSRYFTWSLALVGIVSRLTSLVVRLSFGSLGD